MKKYNEFCLKYIVKIVLTLYFHALWLLIVVLLCSPRHASCHMDYVEPNQNKVIVKLKLLQQAVFENVAQTYSITC